VAEAAEPPQEAFSTRADFEKYIDTHAGVNATAIKKVINCETGGTWNPAIQSNYYLHGVREESYGLSQINLPSHPNISKAQATNPKFALDYIIKNYGKDSWSCK